MKFLGSSIPTTDFYFSLGNSVGSSFNDTLKTLVSIDHTMSRVDFGARKYKEASIRIVKIPESDYHTILAYLQNNTGKKIQIEQGEGEEIFGASIPSSGNTFYAQVLSINATAEIGFTTTNKNYELSLDLSYTGDTISDVYNDDDSSLIDFLITLETNSIGIQFEVDLIADLTGLSPNEGDLCYVKEDKRIYYYYTSTWTKIDVAVNLRKRILDDATLGLSHGLFRLSSFTTNTITESYYNSFLIENGIDLSVLNVSNVYKSGIINENSITFPTSNVSIENGSCVENPNGFIFALNNSERLSKCISKYNFFGAKSSIFVYESTPSRKTLIRSGVNETNEFNYNNLKFKIEPVLKFDAKKEIPKKTISNSSLTSVSSLATEDKKDLNVPQTFGRWEYGRLQTINYSSDPLFANSSLYYKLYEYGDPLDLKNQFRVLLDPLESGGFQNITINVSAENNADFFALLNSNTVYLNVIYGGSGASGSKLITDYAFNLNSLRVRFPLADKIVDIAINDRVEFISRSGKFIIDEEQSKGFVTNQPVPFVYTYNEDTKKYDSYPDGIFAIEDKYTSIEESTQLKINSNIFVNGLSSLADDKININKYYSDDLTKNVIDTISLNQKKPSEYVVIGFPFNYDDTETDYTNLPLATGGSANFFFRKNKGASDGVEYTTYFKETIIRQNFGANASYPTDFSARFLVEDSQPASFTTVNGTYYPDEGNKISYFTNDIYLNTAKYKSGFAFCRFFPVTQKLRSDLLGAENVNLILSQEIGCISVSGSTGYSNINGIYISVDLVMNDNSMLNAFKGRFGDVIANTTVNVANDKGVSGNQSRLLFCNKPTWLGGFVDTDFTATSGTITSTEGLTIFTGGDMITLDSSIFDVGSYLFDNAIGICVSFQYATDLTDAQITNTPVNRFFINDISTITDSDRAGLNSNEIYLSYEQNFDLKDGKFYAKIDGGLTESGSIIENPDDILTKIMSKNNLGTPSFTNLSRDNFKLRKQYFNNVQFSQVLNEISLNSFGVSCIDNDGTVNLKSLDFLDYPNSAFDFTDSHILKDSISSVKFRRNDEIINKFIFNYHYDHATEKNIKQVIVELDSNGSLVVEGFNEPSGSLDETLRQGIKDSLRVALEPLMTLSKVNFNSGTITTKSFDLGMFYDEEIKGITTQPVIGLKEIIIKIVKYFIFNSWEFSFEIPMNYVIYDNSVNKTNKRIEIGDYITIASYFHSNNVKVEAFVKGIKPDFYKGKVKLTVYSPNPPDVQNLYDPVWDGGVGAIDSNDYTFKYDNEYPLKDTLQANTFPDGGVGVINKDDYQFIDNTYANPDEDYDPFGYTGGDCL